MFENVKEPVDIFAETDKAKPVRPAPPVPGARIAVPASATAVNGPPTALYVVIGLVLLGLAGGGYYFFVLKRGAMATPTGTGQPVVEQPVTAPPTGEQPAAPTPPPEPPTTAPGPEVPAPEPQPEPEQPVTPPEPATQPPDDDGDGLSNAEEAALGTNPEAADTDSDGLTDREEVQIYHTNPTNPDTDGDSFLDGQEVKGGYNPNGPGKLFELPPAQ